MSLFLNANMRAVSDVKEHEAADQQVQRNSRPTVSNISTADDKTDAEWKSWKTCFLYLISSQRNADWIFTNAFIKHQIIQDCK